jgi:uncharacterized membrane protein
MNRNELDALAEHHGLTAEAVETALALTAARPTRGAIEHFGVRVLHLAGVLSIAAGIVFFVAANWNALTVFGRFALVQAVLAAAVAAALWRPPPQAVGRYALLLVFLVTGALLALFGQTYQTGADVHELFVSWALLGIVFVIAAQWSVAWAAWVLVLNVALALFCGMRPEAGLFWIVFSAWGLSQSQLLLVPLLVNVLLWAASVALEPTRWARLAPAWLGRFVLACAFAYGTWAGMIVVLGIRPRFGGEGESAIALIVTLVAFGVIAAHTLRRRADVYPLALIAGSLIVLSSAAIARFSELGDIGVMFTLAAWLVASSSVSGHYLMKVVRAWHAEEERA